MEVQPAGEVTCLLRAWNAGNTQALQKLTELVYHDLHRAAHCYMRGERTPHTLQTTALIHEVYIRLVGVQQISWQSRTHFLAVCALLMRRVLIDFAREGTYQKRGGGAIHVSLDEALSVSSHPDPGLLAVDEALKRNRREKGAGGGTALFRRPNSRRDGRGTGGFGGNCDARLEIGKDLVAS